MFGPGGQGEKGPRAVPLTVQSFIFELLSWDKRVGPGEGKSKAKGLCVSMCVQNGRTVCFPGGLGKALFFYSKGRGE